MTEAAATPSTFDIIWAMLMVLLVGWLFCSIIYDAVTGAASRLKNGYLEDRIRQMENELWTLRRRRDDVEWIKIDLRHEKALREIAEDRVRSADARADHFFGMAMSLVHGKADEGQGGAPAQAVA